MSILHAPVTSADHIQGELDAPVVLVEYGDYQCPYCGDAFPIVKALQRRFGEQLCLVFRNFPLAQSHPEAEGAAETAEFAGAHARFWAMHDALYENQTELGLPLYRELAGALNLSPNSLVEALESGKFRSKVRDDFMGGLKSGVNGTPSFFLNGRRHDGGFGLAELEKAIAAEQAGTQG